MKAIPQINCSGDRVVVNAVDVNVCAAVVAVAIAGDIVSVVTPVAATPERLVVPAFAASSSASGPALTAVATAVFRLAIGSSPLADAVLSMLTHR